jgi:hypothetical protein
MSAGQKHFNNKARALSRSFDGRWERRDDFEHLVISEI